MLLSARSTAARDVWLQRKFGAACIGRRQAPVNQFIVHAAGEQKYRDSLNSARNGGGADRNRETREVLESPKFNVLEGTGTCNACRNRTLGVPVSTRDCAHFHITLARVALTETEERRRRCHSVATIIRFPDLLFRIPSPLFSCMIGLLQLMVASKLAASVSILANTELETRSKAAYRVRHPRPTRWTCDELSRE